MTRHERFDPPGTSVEGPRRPLRLLFESLAVLAVATLLVLVPTSAEPRAARADAGPGVSAAQGTPLDRLAAREVALQRSRRPS